MKAISQEVEDVFKNLIIVQCQYVAVQVKSVRVENLEPEKLAVSNCLNFKLLQYYLGLFTWTAIIWL